MQERPEENRIIIVNGEEHAAGKPVVFADDPSLQFGHAFFETLVAFRGSVFQSGKHLARLRRSAAFLELECPSDTELAAALSRSIAANRLESGDRTRLRITLAANRDRKTTWIVEATPTKKYPDSAKAVLLPFVRNERSALTGHKTINYGENVIAQRFVEKQNCEEGIFSNSKEVLCEGIWSNLFLKIDGRILTPPLESGCLPGITRDLIFELAEETGIPICEQAIPVGELAYVESGWFTSTLRGMQKIGQIDGRDLDEPEPEEWKTLSEAYLQRVRSSYANS